MITLLLLKGVQATTPEKIKVAIAGLCLDSVWVTTITLLLTGVI